MPLLSPEQRVAIAVGVPAVVLLLFLWYRRQQRTEISDDEDEEDEPETSKVSTIFETKIEVKVPQNIVGSIIGRGGENIKQIQKESGAYVRFKDDEKDKDELRDDFDAKPPSEDDKMRTVVIKGERERAKKAEMMIKKVISDQPKVFTVDYYIPQKSCGRVIGRGGATIRHLSRVSGARIMIDRSEIRRDEQRKCTLKGTSDQIANAKGLIDEQVAEHELAMARKPLKQRKAAPVREQQVSVTSEEAPSSAKYPNTTDYVEVFISAVDNPGHFWVQLVRNGDAQKLDVLIDTLTNEAEAGNENDVVESVEVGMVCSAPFSHDDSRYRAKVTQINDNGTVDLYYVDYGDSEAVPKYRLRKLKEEYLQLPFQAIECYLANTKPKDGTWDKNATEVFKDLTHYPDWKVIVVKAVNYCGDTPCLDVYDTSTEEDIWVNDEMVKRGFAVEDTGYPPQQPSKPDEYKPKDKDTTEIEKDASENLSQEVPSARKVTTSQDQSLQDEKDAGEGLDIHVSGPVSPDNFSPIKNALVKRVSKEYIETATKGSREASVDVISEERTPEGHSGVVEKPLIQTEVQAGAEAAPEVESIPEVGIAPEVESAPEVKSEPEVEASPEVTGMYESESISLSSSEVNQMSGADSNTLESRPEIRSEGQQEASFYSPKKNSSQILKPEVQEMIEIEVSQAFETELTPSRHIVTQSTGRGGDDASPAKKIDVADSGIDIDVNNHNEPKHVETTLNVDVNAHPSVIIVDTKAEDDANDDDNDDDDDDDDLETFTTTFQQQVQAKKTFVSSVTVTSSKHAAVTLVPSNEKKEYVMEVSSHSTQKSYAQAVRSSKELNQEDMDSLVKSIAGNLGEEGSLGTISGTHGNVFTVQQIEIQAKQDGAFAIGPNGTHVTNETNQAGSFKSISTSQTSQTSSTTQVTMEGVTNRKKAERRSPDTVDSDSESYVSALDEPASDNDTTSNYETAADPTSSSTTSLDYVTADNDTDTDTLRSAGEEGGTPVNSDSDDDEFYDSDDEDDSDAGDKTPKRKTSEGIDDQATPTSMKMATKYLSDMDLGYRGDAEDTTESREDLR